MLFRIDAASFISTINVDSPRDMLSLAPHTGKHLVDKSYAGGFRSF